MRLGVIVALPGEARAVARALHGVKREVWPGTGAAAGYPHAAGGELWSGHLGPDPALVARAGAGPERAALAAECLLACGAEVLLAAGYAGALDPALRPGDLLVATEVAAPDGRWRADASWLPAPVVAGDGRRSGAAVIASAPSLQTGLLWSAARVVTSAAEKRQLGKETEALAVDMESAGVARCAAAAGVPLRALRVITDGAEEALPLDFNQCFDSQGQFRLTRLLSLLARRPLAAGGLLRLGRHSARADRALTACLAALPETSR